MQYVAERWLQIQHRKTERRMRKRGRKSAFKESDYHISIMDLEISAVRLMVPLLQVLTCTDKRSVSPGDWTELYLQTESHQTVLSVHKYTVVK